MAERQAFADYRARLEALGFQPSTTLGQNFLLDPTLHRWLADEAAVAAADTVVEIGVGLGFLTRELASRAGRVVGVEIDERLFAIARAELAGYTNVELVAGDALGGTGRSLRPEIAAAGLSARERGGLFVIVANLPYSISGPLLAEMVALPELPDRAVLLVQKEMAQRVAARPGTPDYGGLAVLVQSVFSARLLRLVPPEVFRPRPRVMSAVLGLSRRADAAPTLVTAAARSEFARFVRRLFQQRRKAMRQTLPAAAGAIGRRAPDLPELARQRAEQLAPDEIVALWAACAPAETH